MDPFLFITESVLAYLISLAAGLRGSAIEKNAQKKIEADLQSISRQAQDRELSRSYQESLELIPIGVAKLMQRLNDTFVDGPITELCIDPLFQKEISRYLTVNDNTAQNKIQETLKEKLNQTFLNAKATPEQAKNYTDQFFGMIHRIIFADRSISNYLIHCSVRYLADQNTNLQKLVNKHSRKLDQRLVNIESQLKGLGASSILLLRPTRAEHFTDREEELEKLLKDLRPGSIVALCGPGGIGKSALAIEALWHLAPNDDPPVQFPDGFVWHDFNINPEVEIAFELIARIFGEEAEPTAMAAAQRALSHRKALLLLDGTEAADNLYRLLSIVGTCGVLLTSQDRNDARCARVDIDPLPMPEALNLLRKWCPSVTEEVGQHICKLVGRLPLAIRLAGHYMNVSDESASDYLSWLQDSPLDALNRGQRRSESVPILFEHTINKIKRIREPACHALQVTGLLALAPFNNEVIAAALDRPLSEVKRSLGVLVRFGLLSKQSGTQRFVLTHRLIHTYAAKSCSLFKEKVIRLADHYAALARKRDPEGQKGYILLESERAHIIRLIKLCEEQNLWSSVTDLVLAVDNYLHMQGYRSNQLITLEKGLKASRQQRDKTNESVFLGGLGNAYHALGQLEKAIEYHEQALEVARKTGHRQGESSRLGNLGNAYHALGQMEKAIKYYKKALQIARKIRHHQGEGNALSNLGNAYYDLGQMENAIDHYKQALKIAREIRHRQGEGNALSNLGNVYRALGLPKEAIKFYEQALKIAREIGYLQGKASDLGNLGNAYHALGQMKKAIEYYEQALKIARKIGHRQGEGNALSNLGNAYYDLGQMENAIDHYKQALKIAREIRHRQGEGNALSNLGNVYRALGQLENAIDNSKRALEIARKIRHRQGEGNALSNLGNAYYDMGQLENAIDYYEQALKIAREIRYRQGEGNALSNLGNAYHSLGQVDKAIEYYEQALEIARKTNHLQGEGIRLGSLGNAYHAIGQLEKAIEYYEQALEIARKTGHRQGEGSRLGNLGNAYHALGQMEKAIKYYEKALQIAREIGHRLGEGSRLGNLGNAYYDLNQLENAIDHYKQALKIAREISHRHGEGNALSNLGNAYRALGLPKKSIKYYEQALKIAREIGYLQGEASDLDNLGNAYNDISQKEKAIKYHEQALQILERNMPMRMRHLGE